MVKIKDNVLFLFGFLSLMINIASGLIYLYPNIVVGVNNEFSEFPDDFTDYSNFTIVKDHFPGTLLLDSETGEIYGSCEYTFVKRVYTIRALMNNTVEEAEISITSIYFNHL